MLNFHDIGEWKLLLTGIKSNYNIIYLRFFRVSTCRTPPSCPKMIHTYLSVRQHSPLKFTADALLQRKINNPTRATRKKHQKIAKKLPKIQSDFKKTHNGRRKWQKLKQMISRQPEVIGETLTCATVLTILVSSVVIFFNYNRFVWFCRDSLRTYLSCSQIQRRIHSGSCNEKLWTNAPRRKIHQKSRNNWNKPIDVATPNFDTRQKFLIFPTVALWFFFIIIIFF